MMTTTRALVALSLSAVHLSKRVLASATKFPQNLPQKPQRDSGNAEERSEERGTPPSRLDYTVQDPTIHELDHPEQNERPALRLSPVPSSRIARVMSYSSLSWSLVFGRSSVSQADALVRKLSRMRGAALKLGQFLSMNEFERRQGDFQGGIISESTVGKEKAEQLSQIWEKVMDQSEGMERWQAEDVMRTSLGDQFSAHFDELDLGAPAFSASLGQVHLCKLSASSPHVSSDFPPGTPLAIKIQFPGVKSSITSDISNLMTLLKVFGYGNVLPKGLFLDRTLQVMKEELVDECDYKREAAALTLFHNLLRLENGKLRTNIFHVPKVLDDLTTSQVLVMQAVRGRPLGRGSDTFNQSDRDELATSLLRLALREVFNWRFMQTDPNWGNFLWDPQKRLIHLIDFGATRSYSATFTDSYLNLILSAIQGDDAACIDWSRKLGYFTGDENEEMVKAHLSSLRSLSTPFRSDTFFHFSPQTTHDISSNVRSQIPLMLKNRLTPPPQETYSLNRKLAGVFMLCARVGGRVKAGELIREVASERRWWDQKMLEQNLTWTYSH